MKRKLLPLLGIAFVVATVATGIFYGLIVNKLPRLSSPPPKQIVVAARDLDRGTALQASDLKLVPWASEMPIGALMSHAGLAGQTLLEPVAQNAPVTEAHLASKNPTGAVNIPAGMRVISVRAWDSAGIVAMLRPGHKVDVQVFRTRQNAEAELRTLVQNLEVVQVALPEARTNAQPVVTLLARPAEADLLGLGDSGARLRLLLRNSVDADQHVLPGLAVPTLFQRSGAHSAPATLRTSSTRPPAQPTSLPVPAPRERQILLRVRIAGAAAAAIEQLQTRLVVPPRRGLLQVAAFRPGWDLEKVVGDLQAQKLIEVYSTSHLLTGPNRAVSMQAGARPSNGNADAASPAADPHTCGIRIQFVPSITATGAMRLRVEPEVVTPQGDGVATRKIETELELADGQSFLVVGLTAPSERAPLLDRLFPAPAAAGRDQELLVLVTPQWTRPAAPAGRQTTALVRQR